MGYRSVDYAYTSALSSFDLSSGVQTARASGGTSRSQSAVEDKRRGDV